MTEADRPGGRVPDTRSAQGSGVRQGEPSTTQGRRAADGAARLDDDGITIRGAQRAVDAWISQFEEGYWPPLSNLARLVEEVGELARELNHLYGHKPKKATEPEQDLALELADILFVILTLANEQGIDLEEAFGRVLEKYRVRDAARWTPKRS
jgi:NTP pyrophosphatase (non-canonical NTP hydrolase)